VLPTLEWKKGDVVGYVSVEKPAPIVAEGQLYWLIAITELHREHATLDRIEDLGLKSYQPVLHKQLPAGRRRKREIELPMFTGRIFIQMPLDVDVWDRVRSVRGVRDFMRVAGDSNKPAVLTDIVIEEVRKMEAKKDAKYLRRLAVAADETASPFRPGRQVWAEILPLRKLLGRIEETNAKGNIEVLLEVEVFGRRVWPVPPHQLQFAEA
jgi:transcription antitermination factor NusG